MARLGVIKDEPNIDLMDAKENVRAELGVGGTLTKNGERTTYPESSLRLFDPKGNLIWMAPQ